MLKLLNSIERRKSYLDRAFPMASQQDGPMVPVELPSEPWAEGYRGMEVPAFVMSNIEKVYGAEATNRGESPIVTMLRYAANAARQA